MRRRVVGRLRAVDYGDNRDRDLPWVEKGLGRHLPVIIHEYGPVLYDPRDEEGYGAPRPQANSRIAPVYKRYPNALIPLVQLPILLIFSE